MLFTISLSAFAQTEVVLIGDSGKDNQGQADVAKSMEQYCATVKCQLGILAGDNIYPVGMKSQDDPILEAVFDKHYNPLKIPFLIALGNHDYGKLSNDWKRGEWQLLHGKKNPYFYIPHFWYTHETPETVFAVIDTSRLMWKKDIDVQAQMVAKAFETAKASKKWFMVVGHHPYLSNGKHGNAGNYERLKAPYFASGSGVKKFLERNVCGKAQFYLSGHDHSIQVLDGNVQNCNTQLVLSGGAATTTKLMVRNPFIFQTQSLGFIHLSVKPEEVKLKVIDPRTVVIFEKTYLKAQ